ncbi:MAG: hypothetical protein RJA25_415 [Bacteroidota bacterium]|jgi:hypothetical protein
MRFLIFIYIFCISYSIGFSQTCITDTYLSQVGVREATGKNDGKEVEQYLKSVGLGKGYAWCAAFVKWSLEQCGIKTDINAMALSAHRKERLVFFKGQKIKEPQPGDVFTLYYPSLKRIGHTGFFHQQVNSAVFKTVEGNTNQAGSREGDGVYIKYRSYNATYSINRWINP